MIIAGGRRGEKGGAEAAPSSPVSKSKMLQGFQSQQHSFFSGEISAYVLEGPT